MAVRVIVAEDSYIVRQGLRQVLEGAPDIEVIAECADKDSLVEEIEARRPDVVLADIRMPPSNTDEGIQVAAWLRTEHPRIGVVILSQYTDPAYVRALLGDSSDGRAYLLKERIHDRRQLVEAIEKVAKGDSIIDPKVVDVLLTARARHARSPLGQLTPRELEVLALLAEGTSNAGIAASLVLTKRAVEKHINAIFLKLNLSQLQEIEDISPRVKAALMFLSDTSQQP